jgi:hypothetical protein
MKTAFKAIFLAIVIMAIITPIAVIAATLATPAVIEPVLSSAPDSLEGINTFGSKNTFYAAGRHWIFYVNDDTDVTYKSSTYGYTWANTDAVATTLLYGFEVACWYDAASNTIHYARHDLNNDDVRYRMGTPGTDGTITWAAVEQVVSATPSDLITFRTTIAVDEEGYPWVAWIDTDGVNAFAQVYVESSSTKNGTWTEAVTGKFGSGGTVANGTGTMTGAPVTLDIGLNQPTVTVAGTFTVTLPEGGTGTATSDGWTITNSPVALVGGANVITVEVGGNGTIDIDLDIDVWAWFVSLTPVDSDKQIQVAYSWEDTSGGGNDGEMGLVACLYDDDTGWDAPQEVVVVGGLNLLRPDAFSFYDHGSAMWVVYTDDDGAVVAGVRSQIESWVEGDWGIIKAIPGTPYYPTISGYRMNPSLMGEDLICIVNSDVEVDYSIHTFGYDVDEWGAWNLAWVVPDLGGDIISRHVATYKYNSPLGFAWQYNDDSGGDDVLLYWWIDNTNDTLGWYSSPNVDNATPLNNIIPLMFVIFCLVMLVLLMSKGEIDVTTIIIAAILIYLMIAFLTGIQATVSAF